MLGYAIFFGFLIFYGGMSVVDQSMKMFTTTGGFISQLDNRFSVIYDITPTYTLLLPNLANPLYLIGLMILMLLLAAQVYPLENILNWRVKLGTIYLFAIAIAILPVFIPGLSYSLYTDIVTLGTVVGILIGLILNIGLNIKLAASTAGDLRRRSVAIIFASVLFYLGFLMSLNIQELNLLSNNVEGLSSAYDLFLGNMFQAIAGLLYWRGLRSS